MKRYGPRRRVAEQIVRSHVEVSLPITGVVREAGGREIFTNGDLPEALTDALFAAGVEAGVFVRPVD